MQTHKHDLFIYFFSNYICFISRERDRQSDRDKGRQTEKEIQTDRQTDRPIEKEKYYC